MMNYAKQTLTHYLIQALAEAGVKVDADHKAEIGSIVDDIDDTIKDGIATAVAPLKMYLDQLEKRLATLERPGMLIQINRGMLGHFATEEDAQKVIEMLKPKGWECEYVQDDTPAVWCMPNYDFVFSFEVDFLNARNAIANNNYSWRIMVKDEPGKEEIMKASEYFDTMRK